MPTNFQKYIFKDQNEHDLEHDSHLKPQFSTPKIYTANGDLSKRWYVYFSFRNPNTGKLERMRNIYGKTNKYKTKEKRFQILNSYRNNLIKLLKRGYNPFEDNTALFEKENQQKLEKIKPKQKVTKKVVEVAKVSEPIEVKPQKIIVEKEPEKSLPLSEALDFALKLKSKEISQKSMKGYAHKVKKFKEWILENRKEVTQVHQVTKKLVNDFLNAMLLKSSPRNRNNYRTELSSIFTVLQENEIVVENYFKLAKKLKTNPEIHKVYNENRLDEIYTHLEKNDTILLLFIKFIGITFMRPIEICRLKVGDVDMAEKTIKFKAKNKPLKTKILPQLLLEELPDLSKMNPNHLLFTPEKIGGEWDADEENRRGHFTTRFKKEVKDKFNLGKDHTLYGFRHTYISKLYKKLRENNSPDRAKSDLMFITGHQTMQALEIYLRSIDAELPEDYSHLLQ